MQDDQQTVIEKAIEFVNVRDALLDTLDEAPSEDRDRRAAQLTSRKDQLLHAVKNAPSPGASSTPTPS